MDDERPEQPPQKPSPSSMLGSSMSEATPYLGLGLEIMVSMVFFVVLGYFGDRWLGTSPWLLIVGALLSLVATGGTLYRTVRELDAKSERAKEGKGERGKEERGEA